MLNSLSIYL